MQVKVEASGHLGEYKKEFFMPEGEEIKVLDEVWSDFAFWVIGKVCDKKR